VQMMRRGKAIAKRATGDRATEPQGMREHRARAARIISVGLRCVPRCQGEAMRVQRQLARGSPPRLSKFVCACQQRCESLVRPIAPGGEGSGRRAPPTLREPPNGSSALPCLRGSAFHPPERPCLTKRRHDGVLEHATTMAVRWRA